MGAPIFRDVRDGDMMPSHVFNRDGELIPTALLRWICPSLTEDDAARIAAQPDAPLTPTSVCALRSLVLQHVP
jgi:hypothetical protein